MNDIFCLKGQYEILAVDKYTGKLLDRRLVKNTIVNTGLERMAKLLNNVDNTYFRAIGIGTGSTGVTTSDTTLETEYTREIATLSYEADYKAKFSKTFTFGSGTSENITEAGIFDSATVSGSTMLNRTTFAAIAITADITLIVNVTITISRP